MFKVILIFMLTVTIIVISQNHMFAQWWEEYDSDDGEYLGRYSSNLYDSGSVSNPYGQYGSPYSSQSINNPYTTNAPVI